MFHPILYFILIGVFAGGFGGALLKRSRSGRIGNVMIGIVGALIGRYAYSHLEQALHIDFIIGPYIIAAICAIVALWLMDVVRGRQKR